jgi:glycerol-3-phosphate dehydrogenase
MSGAAIMPSSGLRDGASPGTVARDPAGVAARRHDLAVVGGGVYGIALALEAARRGLSVALIERGDFGAATSARSLRIVHGGLRYLQGLDLARFRESVAERRFWLACFPDLVRPLPCLMPLHRPPRGGPLRRRTALAAALTADDLLSRRRNSGLRADRALPAGRLLDAAETARRYPGVDRRGLAGAALWWDAAMPDSERLLVELLRWASACGAQAINYAVAERLLVEDGRAAGVAARDLVTGRTFEVAARRVANCAGPWCRELAGRFDRDLPALFSPALAFNLLLDRAPLAAEALAVAAPGPKAPTFFLHPWKGRILAGTRHLPVSGPGGGREAGPSEADIEAFLAELNAAAPGLGARGADVLRVDWGLLPARRPCAARPASRPVLHDHGAAGGPRGLVSVSGVKFTTARAVAERALALLFGGSLPQRRPVERPPAEEPPASSPLPLAGEGGEAVAPEGALHAIG